MSIVYHLVNIVTEFIGGCARLVRGTNIHRQSNHEDNAEGPETIKV